MSLDQGLSNWSYVAMLLFVILGSWWLEFVFKIRVLRKPRALLASILPISVFFLAWDAFAINQGHWTFDDRQILGLFGPFEIPIEEYLFFLIIPIAAVLTLEGVRSLMKRAKR